MAKAALDVLYSAFHKAENRVGGGEGLVGIYGSMTQHGTSNMLAAMAQHTGLGPSSILVDIGSGLCRPLLHASLSHGVSRTYGIELDAVKCQKAVAFVEHTLKLLAAQDVHLNPESLPSILCMGVEQLESLHPATHAYAAWEGFPESAKQAVGRLFATSASLQAITIVQRSLRREDPAEVMQALGFGAVECHAAALPVHMAGSGRKLNAYVFSKVPGVSTAPDRPTAPLDEEARPGLSLLTAPPFDASQVIAELGRAQRPGRGAAGAAVSATLHSLRPRGSSQVAGEASAGSKAAPADGEQPGAAATTASTFSSAAPPATPSAVRSLARATAAAHLTASGDVDAGNDDAARQDQRQEEPTPQTRPARPAGLRSAPFAPKFVLKGGDDAKPRARAGGKVGGQPARATRASKAKAAAAPAAVDADAVTDT